MGNNNAYSVEAWVKTSAAATADEAFWYPEKLIVEIRGEGGVDDKASLSFGIEDTFLAFGRTDDYTTGAERVLGVTAINDGNWHHCVVVIDDDEYTLYVDNSSDASGTFATATGDCSVATDTANFQFGARTTDGGVMTYFWNGSLGAVRIYEKALSVDEVSQNYNAELSRYS